MDYDPAIPPDHGCWAKNEGSRMLAGTLKFLKKKIPAQLIPMAKKLVPESFMTFHIHTVWKQKDAVDWPPPEHSGEEGLDRYEYSLFSQNGEDGLLRYLFSEIGFGSKSFLEFGFGVTENNSLRLILEEGFGGVFLDGSELSVRRFHRTAESFGIPNVQAINVFLNLKNLESTIRETGLSKEIDLLSIDVDGNDYWFWEEITGLSPRIVVIEYNAGMGPQRSLTTPYDPLFDRFEKHSSGLYYGASITAFERLGKKKGYSLVGCDSRGINAFFVRDDCLTPNIPAVASQVAYRPHEKRGYSLDEQFQEIQDMPFVEIA